MVTTPKALVKADTQCVVWILTCVKLMWYKKTYSAFYVKNVLNRQTDRQTDRKRHFIDCKKSELDLHVIVWSTSLTVALTYLTETNNIGQFSQFKVVDHVSETHLEVGENLKLIISHFEGLLFIDSHI